MNNIDGYLLLTCNVKKKIKYTQQSEKTIYGTDNDNYNYYDLDYTRNNVHSNNLNNSYRIYFLRLFMRGLLILNAYKYTAQYVLAGV